MGVPGHDVTRRGARAASARWRTAAATVAAVATALLVPGIAGADDSSSQLPATSARRGPERPGQITVNSRAHRDMVERIKKIWAGKTLRRGKTAVYVVDARSGAELYSVHADLPMNPASNVKLVSTATAVDTLGPDWRYRTRLFGAAPDASGTSHGDVYLRGTSDPTLGPIRIDALAKEVADAGVKRITGDLQLSSHDTRDTMGAPRVVVKVAAPSRAGAAPEVTVSPMSEWIKVEVSAKTTKRRRARLKITTAIEEHPETKASRLVVNVGGTIRAGRTTSVRRNVHRTATFTGHTLRQRLIDHGVQVDGTVVVGDFDDYVDAAADAGFLPITLGERRSKPLSALVSRVNKRSLNFLADRLIKTVGAYHEGGDLSMDKGVSAMHEWLKSARVNPTQVVLDTGSGLSYQTQLSARQIVKVLRVAAGYTPHDGADVCEHADVFRESLAVGGIDGTLRRRFKSGIKGKVVGKTGTLTGVIALSGILTHENGNEIAFSIVSNGHRHRTRWSVRKVHEQMVEVMYDFLASRPLAVSAEGGGAAAATAHAN